MAFFLLENLSGFFQIIHNPFLGSVNLKCIFRLKLLMYFMQINEMRLSLFLGFNITKKKRDRNKILFQLKKKNKFNLKLVQIFFDYSRIF